MLGTDNLKKLIDLGLSVPKQLSVSLADGFQFTDVFSFSDEVVELVRVVRSWKDVIAELHDLDQAERDELHAYFADKFDLPNDEVEHFVEDALAWAVTTIRLYERFRALKK